MVLQNINFTGKKLTKILSQISQRKSNDLFDFVFQKKSITNSFHLNSLLSHLMSLTDQKMKKINFSKYPEYLDEKRCKSF